MKFVMATQMTSARRGIPTEEMKQVAKDEDVSVDWLLSKIARGSIIVPSNNVRTQKIHNIGIGKGLKTKVNVNIGTSTLNVNLEEEIEKAKVAVKYHADTIMDLSDGGDVKKFVTHFWILLQLLLELFQFMRHTIMVLRFTKTL